MHAPAPVSWHDPVVGPLDEIEIEGFLSIRSLRLELKQLNVLIGANGSGKSNLVAAFQLLGDIADSRLRLHVGYRGGPEALLHFGQEATKKLRLRARFGPTQYECVLQSSKDETLMFASERVSSENFDDDFGGGHYETAIDPSRGFDLGANSIARQRLTREGNGAGSDANRVVADVLRTMQSWRVFQFHDTSASAGMRKKHAIDDNRMLRPDGSNLAAVLYALRQIAPIRYRSIVDFVRSIAPFFEDFLLEPDALNTNVIRLAWRHRSSPRPFFAHSLSDGTLRYMCLATLLHHPKMPSLIVIDEPELGLHPAAVMMLSEMIRVVAHRSQVIIATQSATLLDQVAIDDVIVVDRTTGESTFHRLTGEQIKLWGDDYSLGDLWLKNVLGGLPGSP